MRLTRGSDYGLRGMLYLAKLPLGKVALVSEVAVAENLPESYLAKIFQDLTRNGLLLSHRGAKGGFSLVRLPSEITMQDIIEAVEGPIAISPCLDEREGCVRIDDCQAYPALAAAQERLLGILGRTTLADLNRGVWRDNGSTPAQAEE
jgi:Rrf2 family iron-sulfur cluster assembly transcriptional regulator